MLIVPGTEFGKSDWGFAFPPDFPDDFLSSISLQVLNQSDYRTFHQLFEKDLDNSDDRLQCKVNDLEIDSSGSPQLTLRTFSALLGTLFITGMRAERSFDLRSLLISLLISVYSFMLSLAHSLSFILSLSLLFLSLSHPLPLSLSRWGRCAAVFCSIEVLFKREKGTYFHFGTTNEYRRDAFKEKIIEKHIENCTFFLLGKDLEN